MVVTADVPTLCPTWRKKFMSPAAALVFSGARPTYPGRVRRSAVNPDPDEITELKKRIEELERQFRHSLAGRAEDSKAWAMRVAALGAAVYKAGNMFATIGRNMEVPNDIRDLATAGRVVCDQALAAEGVKRQP
jgi:hypothetical protein